MAQSLTVGSGLQQHSQAITPVTTAATAQRSFSSAEGLERGNQAILARNN